LDKWQDSFWETGQMEGLIGELVISGDCQESYFVQFSDTGWKEIVINLLKKRRVRISSD
jgi:hypothetical protein